MRALIIAFAAAAVALSAGPALGVETAMYGDADRQDLSSGERQDVYVSESGALVLAPAQETLYEGADYVWCIDVDGESIYFGTVPEGAVYRVKDGKAEALCKTGEAGVFSILATADGVYAGTGPEGKVFRIGPDGKAQVAADLDEQYVFALAAAPGGAVLAATGGGQGRIYRLSGGAPTLVYDSPSAHLMALAVGEGGDVYAASGNRGAIYKVSPDGEATVLFTAPEQVVEDVAVGPDGSVYACTAAISGDKGSEDDAVSSIFDDLAGRDRSAPARQQKPERTYEVSNSLYRIRPGGEVRQIMTLPGGLIMSILPIGDSILCGAAGKPGIYRVGVDGERGARIGATESAQVLDLAATDGGGFAAALGMPGGVVRFGPDLARTGTFTSRVIKADGLTRWGRIWWAGACPAGTGIAMSVRNGNTPRPDSTWTDWRLLETEDSSAQVDLPPSRYIQYRAQFSTSRGAATPSVTRVSIAGLAVNLPPDMSGLAAGKERPGGARTVSGSVDVSWKAEDPNGDDMVYEVALRDDEMDDYMTVARALFEPKWPWDTTTVPDGQYRLRITASDKPGNPAGGDASRTLEDGPFIVDNTPPVLSNLSVRKTDYGWRVAAEARDSASILAAASSSVDGSRWSGAPPEDGIFDSPRETVVVRVEKPDAKVVIIRVRDGAGNWTAARGFLRAD